MLINEYGSPGVLLCITVKGIMLIINYPLSFAGYF